MLQSAALDESAVPLDVVAEIAAELTVARRADIRAADAQLESWPTHPSDEGDERGPYLFDLSPQETQLLDALFAELPGEKLGHGVSRIVIRLDACPEYAVKFGRWGPDITTYSGRKHNELEATLYETRQDVLPERAANVLLPVVAAGDEYSWLLQPFAVTLKDGWGYETVFDDAESHPVQRELWDAAAPIREQQYASTEGCLSHNIGYWRGRWYILDYGTPKDGRDDVLSRLSDAGADNRR